MRNPSRTTMDEGQAYTFLQTKGFQYLLTKIVEKLPIDIICQECSHQRSY